MKLNYPIYCPAGPSAAYDWQFTNEQITNDFSTIAQALFKIIAVPVMCTETTDFSYNTSLDQINFNDFDLVLLSDIEYRSINQIKEWAKKNNIHNYLLASGGQHNNEHIDPSTTIYRPWWAFNLLNFNTYQDSSGANKPFQFDALLGARRPHRDYVMLAFQKYGMLDSSIVTYRDIFCGHWITDQYQNDFNLTLEYPYVSPNLDPSWEVADKLTNSISPFVPWNIYAHTNYTILCETLGIGDTFFLSEKPAKPIYAKRLFVPFSTPNYLKNMRALGFETFADIIDESFDQIIPPIARWKQTIEQVRYLEKQDAGQVYEKINPILEHNHNLLVGMPAQIQCKMKTLLKETIPEQHWKD